MCGGEMSEMAAQRSGEERMTFEIGRWVKWSDASPTRLGHTASDIGEVVAVHEFPAEGYEIDVQFSNGEVVRGAAAHWFEPAEAGGRSSPRWRSRVSLL